MSPERTRDAQEREVHDHDRGLAFDLATMNRRRALLLAAGGLATVTLAACGSSNGSGGRTTGAAATGAGATTSAGAAGATATIAEETAGPYPGDGSNGPNVLTQSGIVRRDITPSFGSASGMAEGVPLTLDLTILDVAQGGAPAAGAAVYLWHCDREGRYSLYSQGATDQNYLRGVQEADADGKLGFTTIWPGAYAGRWPHIHFEVYPTLAEAVKAGSKLVTSQIALPEAACNAVYATAGYEQSVQNLAQTSLQSDMVFADGYSTQLGTASGSPSSGMTVALNVGV